MAASFTPLDTPLAPIPDDALFADEQWDTLLSLSDVVIPALTLETTSKKPSQKAVTAEDFDLNFLHKANTPDAAQVARQYWVESFSSDPIFKEALRRLLLLSVPEELRNRLSLVLNVLK